MSERRSRVVQLRAGQDRSNAINRSTVVWNLKPRGPVDYRALFFRNYAAIRETCLEASDPGLAIFAIDPQSTLLAGSLRLRARPDRIATGVMGRHGCADLYLEGDESLSLRHLLVVIEPLTSYDSGEVRFRMIDLRTDQGFLDEGGRRLESLVAEGPVFVMCGRFALLVMITGDATNFPAEAAQAWSFVPERVFLEEAEVPEYQDKPAQRRPVSERPLWVHGKSPTLVTSLRGPSFARAGHLDETPLGRMIVESASGRLVLVLGDGAARRGVLFGRYDRCNADALRVLEEDGISRVHLLLLSIGGRLYAIDTGSTYGSYVDKETSNRARSEQFLALGTACDDLPGDRIRCVELEHGTDIILGLGFATLRWALAV